MADTRLDLWDFAALRYLGREKAQNAPSGLKHNGVPLSMRTCALLFARVDLLIDLAEYGVGHG